MRGRVVIEAGSVPKLSPHVRLSFDRRRGRWVMLAPERVMVPDEIALSILKRCTGEASVAAIAGELAGEFDAASPGEVEADVKGFLQEMADKGMVEA